MGLWWIALLYAISNDQSVNVFSIFTPAALPLPTPSPEPPAVSEVKGQTDDLEGGYGSKSLLYVSTHRYLKFTVKKVEVDAYMEKPHIYMQTIESSKVGGGGE